MAIGTPVDLSGNVGAGGTADNIAATLTSGCGVDDRIVVVVSSSTTQRVLTAVTDSRGNTYTVDKTQNDAATTGNVYFASAQCTTALQTGDTVTATFASSLSSTRTISVFAIPGAGTVTGTPNGRADAGGADADTTSTTTTAANAIVIGASAVAAAGTITWNAGTELYDYIQGTRSVSVVYDIKSATGTYGFTGTWTGAGTKQEAVVAYAAASGTSAAKTASDTIGLSETISSSGSSGTAPSIKTLGPAVEVLSGDLVLGYPPGWADADLAFMHVVKRSPAGTGTMAVPDGWTAIGSPAGAGGGTISSIVAYRPLSELDSGQVTVVDDGAAGKRGRIFTIGGYAGDTPVDVAGLFTHSASLANPPVVGASVTTVTGNTLLLFFAATGDDAVGTVPFGTPAGMSDLYNEESLVGSDLSMGVFTETVTGAGATGDRTATSDTVSSTRSSGLLVAVRPGSTGFSASTITATDTATLGETATVDTGAIQKTAADTAAFTEDVADTLKDIGAEGTLTESATVSAGVPKTGTEQATVSELATVATGAPAVLVDLDGPLTLTIDDVVYTLQIDDVLKTLEVDA